MTFSAFWDAYPKKVSRKKAEAIWDAKKLDDHSILIVNHVKLRATTDKRWKEGFVLDPTTFLSQERWSDEYERVSYKQIPSKATDVQAEILWPQTCPHQTSMNGILLELLKNIGGVSDEGVLRQMVALKREMGIKMLERYGNDPAPDDRWSAIKQRAYQQLKELAVGRVRADGVGTSRESEGERAAA